MLSKKFALLVIFLVASKLIMAQYYFVAKVLDSKTQEPLVGATVVQKGSNNGTTSDANGKVKLPFSMTGSYKLSISYVGYKTEDVTAQIPQQDTSQVLYLTTNETQLEEVVVSSVRTNSTIENVPTKIEVLGLEDVTEENGIKPGNILSLISDVAGIQMQQVSASSGNTYARIQGLDGRYTQILKDGLPLFGGMSGGLSIMQIPPLDLKQIEIIKGCGSTLYGADAIGGIINLISKKPQDKQELSLTANQTTLSETNLNVYASKKYKHVGYTLFAGETLQKQMDIDKDGLSDVPNVNSFVVHPKLVFYVNPNSTLTLNYTGTFDNRKGGAMSYLSSPGNNALYHIINHSERHSGDLNWNYNFSETANLTAKFSNSLLDQRIGTKYYNFKATQNIYYSEVSYHQSTAVFDWVLGVNLNGDIFYKRSENFMGVQDYNYQTFGYFIQNTWKVSKKLSVEGGFREDHHSRYGNFYLPRLSLMYKFNKQFTGRINGGIGSKIPVQFSYIDPETDLNNMARSELQPERAQGLNADINYSKFFSNDVSLTINQSFFFTKIYHPVVENDIASNAIMLMNAPKPLRTQGLQTYVRFKYNDLEVYMGYVYTDVRKAYDATHPTPYTVPRHQFSSTYFYDFTENFAFGLETSYFAGQLNEDYNKTKDYLIMAAMFRYTFKSLTFVLNGENLLDFRQNKYEQIYNGSITDPVFRKLWAPIDGRVINLSVKWTIK